MVTTMYNNRPYYPTTLRRVKKNAQKRPMGSPKYGTTPKNTQRYYTTKCLISYMYSYSEISFALPSCAVDNGTRYIHTMTDTQRFQLIPFRWIKNYTLVYLHCNVIVCHKDQPSRCSKGCPSSNPRRTRSTGNEEEHSVTLGPVMLRGTQRSESSIVYKGKSDAQFICRRLNVFLMLSFIESLVTGSVVECFIDQIVAGWTSVGIGELRNFFRLQLVF